MLTPRENVLRLLRREGFESIPCDFNLCPSLWEDYRRIEKSPLDVSEFFGFPWRGAPGIQPTDTDNTRFHKYHLDNGVVLDESVSIDEWGVGHRKTPTSMHMTQMLYPLDGAETIEDITSYPMPVYEDGPNAHIKDAVAQIQARGLAAMGNTHCTIWEKAWYMRGMENLMADMLTDEDMATALFDMVEERAVKMAQIYAEAGVDILFLGDDIGMQHTIMMSDEVYCKWLKPRLKNVIDAARAIKPDLLVMYHSCGFVEPFIEHLIEVGVDVLNPVQPECMDFAEIHAKYGDRLSFHGTIGTQSTMPFGTAEEVAAAVQRNLDIAGAKGGLFPAPTHLLEPEVPWENIRAYAETCKSYKRKI